MALPDVTASGGPPPELPRSAHRVDFALPATDEAVAEAREQVRHHSDAWHLGADSRDTAALVVSELVTNVVVHTDSDAVTCVFAATDEQVLIQVEDNGSGRSAPEPRYPPAHHSGGRGLMIVEAVSRCWGASGRPDGGHVVWAMLQANDAAG
ncbi:ATP-binding protein [Streptomyces acidiscabies]|uniref:ATP-binding protein n=1 Tax=Streptomyces acidiscabies TaxID=42234 RepID=UPI0038F63DE6